MCASFLKAHPFSPDLRFFCADFIVMNLTFSEQQCMILHWFKAIARTTAATAAAKGEAKSQSKRSAKVPSQPCRPTSDAGSGRGKKCFALKNLFTRIVFQSFPNL